MCSTTLLIKQQSDQQMVQLFVFWGLNDVTRLSNDMVFVREQIRKPSKSTSLQKQHQACAR